jgi:CRISPR-associated endonuclease/helicase Cas3
MGEEGKPGGSWFTANKRELLAPFGVGTIDQVLMSVMNVKHGFVRAFGLAGKVVILDEIHSYDSYTGTIIDKLIESLVASKCTVIILSATLTEERRKALLMHQKHVSNQQYPLISYVKDNSNFGEIPVIPDEDKVISIQQCCDDFLAIEEALNRAEGGQQVLWIENTVQEAQMIYKIFAAKTLDTNISCGLLHSCFIRTDRQSIESKWIDVYGKHGADKRMAGGRILIGTQVLEQSIDIDADFLISRICPTDFLLQRIGRLWRHKQTKRPISAKREAWFLSGTLEFSLENYKSSFGKTAFVYSPYYLIRTLEVWSCLKEITLPSQMRSLIEATYKIRPESELMNVLKNEVEKRKSVLQSLARIGLSKDGKTLSDEKASTRYSEQDNHDVLIIRNIRHADEGKFLQLANGEEIFLPKNQNKILKKQVRELSISLLENIVKVSKSKAPEVSSRNELLWLKDYLHVGNQEDCLLTVVKLLPSDELVSLDGTPCSSKTLNYNSSIGYYANE